MLPCAPKVSIKECSRGANPPKNIRKSPSSIVCNKTELADKINKIKPFRDQDRYLIGRRDCNEKSSIDKYLIIDKYFLSKPRLTFFFIFRFNKTIVPTILVLGLVSSGLAFIKFDMSH